MKRTRQITLAGFLIAVFRCPKYAERPDSEGNEMSITRNVALIGSVVLAGCTAPDDYAGEIVAFNGNMVVIEGVMNQPDGMDVKPTPAMQASAEDACQGPAKYVGWDDEKHGGDGLFPSMADTLMVTYRFLCR